MSTYSSCNDPEGFARALEAGSEALDHQLPIGEPFSFFDTIAQCLAVKPEHYEASDCEQALHCAILAEDVTASDLLEAVSKMQDALPPGFKVQAAYTRQTSPAVMMLVLALKRVLAAWVKGDYPGDFGEHLAVREAQRALAVAGPYHKVL